MAKRGFNNWNYANRHVDSTINENRFTTSARCLIYAAPNLGGTDIDEFTDFSAIGVIQGYNWSEQRQIEMIFELGSEIPYLVPGRASGQISISRILVSGADLVNVLHGNDKDSDPDTWIRTLKDISKPMNILFAAYPNTNSEDSNQTVYSRLFRNCWITGRQESIAAGQILVAENCSIMYQDIPEIEFM